MSDSKITAFSFLAPKYWPTWFILGFLRLIVFLPYKTQMWLGRQLGNLSYALIPKRKNIVKTNIRLCYPELSEKQQKLLVQKTIESTGMGIIEIGLSWWASESFLRQSHTVDGIENLHDAIAKNKGVILLASHFTTIEMKAAFLGFYSDKIKYVYKRAHDPLFEWFLSTKRLENCAGLLQHKNLRDIIRSIKQGNIVTFSPDQDFGEKDSVFAPFMGISTCTLTSPQRLAQISGAPIVPVHVKRSYNSKPPYSLHFGPIVDPFPTDDSIHDATSINNAIENQIATAPEQYLWAHRRFKSRPNGEEDVYTNK